MQAALLATNAFTDVWLTGLPEDYGHGASELMAASIEPLSSTQRDLWDSEPAGGLEITSQVTITLLARQEDPQLRDEAVELLFDTAADALNGQSLASFTEPPFTRFTSWRWEKPSHPERRIVATFEYRYIVEGWESYDTTP